MSAENERSYLQRRAAQERRLAAAATDPGPRHTHSVLAEMFEDRLSKLGDESQRVLSLRHSDRPKGNELG